MTQTVEIEISGLHFDTHEQLEEALEEQYDDMLQSYMQDAIEDIYEQLQEAQAQTEDVDNLEEDDLEEIEA